jgi:sugar-specific transcriptional regulator TrmB
MNNQTIEGLIGLGLTAKEALLYSTSLKTGPTTAQILSLESGLKRATIYGLIDSLIAQGLLHTEIKGVRKLFVAESPDKLAALLEKKKQVLTSIMPHLVQDYLHSSHTKNTIKMYHGLSGIKLLYDNILTTLQPGDDYLVISDQAKWHALDPEYFEAFIKKRSAFNLVIKLILQDTLHAQEYHLKEEQYAEKIKFLPETMQLNMNLVIYGNHILLIQTVEPLVAILIENDNVAAMHRVLFNTIWELL